jgi:hypothetical protein
VSARLFKAPYRPQSIILCSRFRSGDSWIQRECSRRGSTRGRQDLEYFSTRSRYSVVTLEIGMPGTHPPRSDRKTQFRRNYFVSWLNLEGLSNRCSAGYSIFGTTATQFPERPPYLSQLNEVLVLPILPMILCKYFCKFPGQFSRHQRHPRLTPRYFQISDSKSLATHRA